MLSYLFVAKGIPNAPLWLHVGLAQYFQATTVQSGPGQLHACFGASRRYLGSSFRAMPLEKFFALGWKEYPRAEVPYYLGTANLLMNYIFHGDDGAHLPKLPAIFRAAAQGTPGPQIMAEVFPGMTLAQLGQRIYDFGGSISEQRGRAVSCPLPIPIPPDRAPDESIPQESPIAPQEIDQLMQALKRLPHGDRFPPYYPPEILGAPAATQNRRSPHRRVCAGPGTACGLSRVSQRIRSVSVVARGVLKRGREGDLPRCFHDHERSGPWCSGLPAPPP